MYFYLVLFTIAVVYITIGMYFSWFY
uniref:Uncharacterized protein n=1 Tax=Arundo donax TaxID=35708 RepID=A0A0A8Z9H6_ARUDO